MVVLDDPACTRTIDSCWRTASDVGRWLVQVPWVVERNLGGGRSLLGGIFLGKDVSASPWPSVSRFRYLREPPFLFLNLTNPKPLCLPEDHSIGGKESIIEPALQNMDSNSVLEITGGRIQAKREKTREGGLLL